MRVIGLAMCGVLLAGVCAAAQLRRDVPSAVGMSAEQLKRASALLAAEVESGRVGAASLLVARRGCIVLDKGFGVPADAVFLLASITKPVTACALMLLVERGQVGLSDPVNLYFPEFTGEEREKIRVRDLLSHTSGLPDMLPENTELRRAHAPLSEFVNRTLKTPLLFPPGTSFRYQSMGTLLAGTIVEKVTGQPLREFEKKEMFEPLGMKDSSLGLGGRKVADLVPCMTSPKANKADEERFGPNSDYWRDMGHPWGGMHSTTADLAILLQTFLDGGTYGGTRLFSPATVAQMIRNQNEGLNNPWGLGWALAPSRAWNALGDLVSARAFGHAGATGTVAWADPETKLLCVILTNRPYGSDSGRLLRRVSNAVAAAVE